MDALTWTIVGLLFVVTARRFALLVGALVPPRPLEGRHEPTILVVVAARDEANRLPPLLDALEALDYPAQKLSFVFVSDGSRDHTTQLFQRWCHNRPRATVLHLGATVGKGAAINAALRTQDAEVLVIYDADLRPRPDSLRRLAQAFANPRVAAIAGYRSPSNPDEGIVSQYAALEAWVHQLVVLAGKDRWGWNPPTMGGNCAYRIDALKACGGFRPGTLSEDIEASLSLIASGWTTRFARDAVAEDSVSAEFRHYAAQRLRWTYGMHGAGTRARSPEALVVASGYADRLIFAAGCVSAIVGWMSPVWLVAYLMAPLLHVLAALAKTGRLRQAGVYLLGALPMFLFDIACTTYATFLTLVRRRPVWHQPSESVPDTVSRAPD